MRITWAGEEVFSPPRHNTSETAEVCFGKEHMVVGRSREVVNGAGLQTYQRPVGMTDARRGQDDIMWST